MDDIVLNESNLSYAILSGASLVHATIFGARLNNSTIDGANLSNAMLNESSLFNANFYGANLTEAYLSFCNLTQANFQNAILNGANVYGVAVWETNVTGAQQKDLVVQFGNQTQILVDSLHAAQFIFMATQNEQLKDFIENVGTKIVLVLGRFSPTRIATLKKIKVELRKRGYIPVLFDFDKPGNKTILETVQLIAHLSLFVVADFSDAKIVLAELEKVVDNTSVPVVPIIIESQKIPPTLREKQVTSAKVLGTVQYNDDQELIDIMDNKIIKPAVKKAEEIREAMSRIYEG